MFAERTKRFWKIAFGLSLAVNLLVLGVVGSAVVNGSEARTAAAGFRGDGLFALTAMLPRADRDALRDRSRNHNRSGGDRRAEQAAAILSELRRADFSPQRFADLLQQARDARSAGALRAEQMLAERVAGLSEDARQAYADRLERALNRRPKPRKN